MDDIEAERVRKSRNCLMVMDGQWEKECGMINKGILKRERYAFGNCFTSFSDNVWPQSREPASQAFATNSIPIKCFSSSTASKQSFFTNITLNQTVAVVNYHMIYIYKMSNSQNKETSKSKSNNKKETNINSDSRRNWT